MDVTQTPPAEPLATLINRYWFTARLAERLRCRAEDPTPPPAWAERPTTPQTPKVQP